MSRARRPRSGRPRAGQFRDPPAARHLAVCAIAAVGFVARDFLIPTAAAIVLALILTPVANTLERIHAADARWVLLLALVLAGILSLVIPQVARLHAC